MKITLPKHPIRDMTRQEKLLWLGSAGAVLLANLCSGAPDGLTLCAALVGVTSLVLAAGGNVWSQILMILFSILYGAISFRFRLPSMDKGKYGFSGAETAPGFVFLIDGRQPACFVSLPGHDFRSRKTPKDFPARKNQGWRGRGQRWAVAHRG